MIIPQSHVGLVALWFCGHLFRCVEGEYRKTEYIPMGRQRMHSLIVMDFFFGFPIFENYARFLPSFVGSDCTLELLVLLLHWSLRIFLPQQLNWNWLQNPIFQFRVRDWSIKILVKIWCPFLTICEEMGRVR